MPVRDGRNTGAPDEATRHPRSSKSGSAQRGSSPFWIRNSEYSTGSSIRASNRQLAGPFFATNQLCSRGGGGSAAIFAAPLRRITETKTKARQREGDGRFMDDASHIGQRSFLVHAFSE